MKKLFLGLGLVLAMGCSNDEQFVNETENLNVSNINTAIAPVVVNPIIQKYYDNVKIIVFATQINKASVARELGGKNIGLVDEITNLNILDEETNKQISFFDLEENYQVLFIDEYMNESARMATNKIRYSSDVVNYFDERNKILEEVMVKLNITSMASRPTPDHFYDEIDRSESARYTGESSHPVYVPEVGENANTFTVNSLAAPNAQRGDILVA